MLVTILRVVDEFIGCYQAAALADRHELADPVNSPNEKRTIRIDLTLNNGSQKSGQFPIFCPKHKVLGSIDDKSPLTTDIFSYFRDFKPTLFHTI
jgi:hypothetical protein